MLRILAMLSVRAFVAIESIAVAVAVLGASGPEKAVTQGALDDFDDRQGFSTAEALRELLTAVPGQPSEITETRKWDRPIRRISGLFRLEPRWSAGRALRLSILDPQQFQMHLRSPTGGVTLRYYPDYHQTWAAYGTRYQGSEPRPSELALWATSEDYYRRSGAGTVELHIQSGTLYLVRGDLTLLAVPLKDAPTEAYLEGSALIRGMAWVESRWQPEPVRTRPAVVQTDRPAELSWRWEPSEGAVLAKLPDGSVQWQAVRATRPAQALVALQQPGLYEMIFEVEQADVGTGVSLCDEQDKLVCRLGFFRHQQTGKKVFDLLPPWASDVERSFDPNRQPVPYAGQPQWLRVVCGAGVFKLFTSGDGVWWRQPSVQSPGWEGACVRVGLFCLPGPSPRAITLRRLAIRRLDTLTAGVPEPLLDRVGKPGKPVNKLDEWELWVAASRPADVPPALWWRACAVRTLTAGVPTALAQSVLNRLQQAVLEDSSEPNAASLVSFMEDCALVHATEEWTALDRLLPEARRFGWVLVRWGHPEPFTAASRAMLRWPWWGPRRLPVFSDELLRHELFLRVARGPDEQTREFCRRTQFWNHSGGPRDAEQPLSRHGEYLIQWADPVFVPTPGATRRNRRSARPPSFQTAHPLIETIGKEAYSAIADLRAAIDNQAYREAGQILASVAQPDRLGLVPDSDDPRWLLSYPLAVAAEVRNCQELQNTLREDFGKIGQVRLQGAVMAGDEAGVEAIASQFPGTSAAADAHRWLGDRRLASGRWAEALAHYRQAAKALPTADCDALAARSRLAGALAGLDLGEPIQGTIRLGGTSLSATDFEHMVAGLRAARGASGHLPAPYGGTMAPASLSGFRAGRYALRPWALLEGQNVRRPQGLHERTIDWAGRQMAVLVTPGLLIFSNRLELVAFDLPTGQQRWSVRSEVEERHQQGPLVAMQPVLLGDHVVARRLSNDGPELVCLQAADGKVVWTARPDDYVASDPVVLDERLLAITVARDGSGATGAFLVELDRRSGRVRRRSGIAEFREAASRGSRPLPLACPVAVADDRLVATVAGCVLAFSPSGRVHWVRRQVWAPPPPGESPYAPQWIEPYHEPPVLRGGRVYATQPGVWGIECLEAEDGRLVWRQAVGNLTRLLGFAGTRLILQTQTGLAALDGATGSWAWMQEVPHLLGAQLVDSQRSILALARQDLSRRTRKDSPDMMLAWYDPEQGRLLGSCLLEVELQPRWHIGPWAAASARQWLALATEEQPARRHIFEAVRLGEADAPQAP